MNYTIAQESRIGGREINQDRATWLATEDAVLLVVADGMGGHLQGEVAAQLAIDTIAECFRIEAKPRLANPTDFLTAAMHRAHRTIVNYAAECQIEPHAAPRTTCIACVVQDGQASWAHAGDSRLYLIHNPGDGKPRVAHTRDHSIVQNLVDEGSISPAEAANHPMRNRVFSCLGGLEAPHIEVSATVSLEDGDLIALCTDGAWWPLGEKLVNELGGPSLTDSVPHLLDAAERAAGPEADNLTLIAMRWEAPKPKVEADPPFCDTYIGQAPISDEEIENAINEIRRRIPNNPHGASS
ncbi:MAG: protein phosphatase 2C domain-containing protein [Sulfuritalea sp.]|nr:protein phosphatase 2C domain-containing protein [Sulfuritalea sp.]